MQEYYVETQYRIIVEDERPYVDLAFYNSVQCGEKFT